MNKRIVGLDLLRVIGVIFIFCYHFTVEYIYTAMGTDPAMSVLNYFFNVLARPASLFLFIISGYALMYNQEDKISAKDFYIRRFKGLFIPFYVAYTIMFVVSFLVENVTPGNVVPLYRFLFTICGMDGLMQIVCSDFYLIGEWFMSNIVCCYIVFPLLAKLIKKWKYIVFAILLIWYVILLFFFNPFPITPLMNPFLIVVYFYFGMLLYEMVGNMELSKKTKITCTILSVLIWVYFLLAGYTPWLFPFKLSDQWAEVLNIVWSIALILALRDVHINSEKKAYKIITYISGISWFVILLHHRIMILFYSNYSVEEYSRRENFAMFLACVFVTWIAAEVVRKLSNKVKRSLFK